MDVRQIVAWNLRRLRVAKGISQDELALQADVERAYVGHLERATKNPTVLTLEKLAKALGCEMQEIFKRPAAGSEMPKPLARGRKKA